MRLVEACNKGRKALNAVAGLGLRPGGLTFNACTRTKGFMHEQIVHENENFALKYSHSSGSRLIEPTTTTSHG